jgi:peptidoglycan-N-acetylmuramic acid deacetylase
MRKRDLWIISAAVCAAVILALAQFAGRAIHTGSWGLSFPEPGRLPQGPASGAALAELDAAYAGSGEEPVLYLTFDAGYENGYTEQILDVLKAHQVPAAFFLVGNYIEKNADLVRRMVEEGHIVANHTMHHPDMSRITDPAAFEAELRDLEALFTQVTGKELPRYYRPPQGIYSRENLELAKALGYKTLFWSLAYADWDNNRQPTKQEALDKLLPRTHNGAVILLHATSKTNAEVLGELLTAWEKMGYRFAPISELFSC